MKLDRKSWEFIEDQFPLNTKLPELLGTLREEAETRLEKDDMLIRLKKNILFRPEIQLVPEISRYANPDSFGRSHVQEIGDLFTAISKKSILRITVILEDSGKVCRSKEAEKVLINDWADECTYYRVGIFQKR